MRWTAENENILWRTIFQTQNLTLELDKVSEAWPGDDKPTPKAIKEKLDKYRNRESGNAVSLSLGPNLSPRKTRTGKKSSDDSANTGEADAGPNVSPVVKVGPPGATPAPARGRGRPRKEVSSDPTAQPAAKKVKVEPKEHGPSPSPIVEVQIPKSPPQEFVITKPQPRNMSPFMSDQAEEHVQTAPNLSRELGSFLERDLGVYARSVSSGADNDNAGVGPWSCSQKLEPVDIVGIQKSEAYQRCGEMVDCKGGGCGQPRCVSCFGEWDGHSW